MSGRSDAGKALLLGAVDYRAPLAVVRSLGRGGVETHFAWHRPENLALTSRYAGPRHDLPSFREGDERRLDPLAELLERERFDLVIPIDDTSTAALQQSRERLAGASRLYTIPDECFRIFMDKVRTAELARKVGVRVPEERVLTTMPDIDELIGELGLPIVLKPGSSYNPANPTARRLVTKAFTRDELVETLPGLLEAGSVAAQRNFLGVGVGVELLLRDGRPLLEFQHERVNEPLHGGGSSYRKSVAVDPELREAALALLGPLRYTGVAMVEFKVDHRTGEWVLIEVNPRFWGSLPLAVGCGVDFPLALYRLLVKGEEPTAKPYPVGVHSRAWRENLQWQMANLRADSSDPTLATQTLGKVVGQTAGNLVRLRERSDTLAWDDLRPAWAELREMAGSLSAGAGKRVGRALRSLGPRREAARRNALAASVPARKALFVCYGNICRSPYAELLTAEKDLFAEVRSAGFIEREGRSSPPEARTEAANNGIDLTGHRSALLRREDVDWADVIYLFDTENRKRMTGAFPDALDKTHYWGAMGDGPDPVIPDPYGGGPEAFAECYRRIGEAANRLVSARESRERSG